VTNARTTYRENTVRGASPVRLVVLLYEQLIQDLTQASQALEQNDVALRTSRINHAILVLGHLQSGLNFTAGGKVAQNLQNFYDALRSNLVRAQFQQSRALLAQQITDLLSVREAWIEVERAENPTLPPADLVAADAAAPASDAFTTGAAHLDWKG